MTTNLSTQIRKSYTYLILFYDGSFYYGVRLCPKGKTPWQDTNYVGSPVTHRDKWNTTPFTKFILEVFDDYDQAQKKEKELIKPNLNNPICLNEHATGCFSRESCSKAGKIAMESGQLASIRAKGGKIQGRRNAESDHLKKIAHLGGKVGGKIGGRKNIESGHIQKLGKEYGKKNVESGHLDRIRNIKYRCLITGFISTAGALAIYQKARGIDTNLRERIE